LLVGGALALAQAQTMHVSRHVVKNLLLVEGAHHVQQTLVLRECKLITVLEVLSGNVCGDGSVGEFRESLDVSEVILSHERDDAAREATSRAAPDELLTKIQTNHK
jgi:hypothetical protein